MKNETKTPMPTTQVSKTVKKLNLQAKKYHADSQNNGT